MKTSKKLLVFSYTIMGDNMKDKLPKVFANSLNRQIKNNERVYHFKENEIEPESKVVPEKKMQTEGVNDKINSLFKSTRYVYKMDVEITTKSGTVKKKIIGKNKTNLITIENELIAIADILDIKVL